MSIFLSKSYILIRITMINVFKIFKKKLKITGIIVPKRRETNIIVLFRTRILYSSKYSSVDYSILKEIDFIRISDY